MKNIGHITNENTFMMCPNFIYWILQVLKDSKVSKSLINQGLLACLFDSNRYSNGHTNHGVVTGADEAHHLYALDPSLTHGGVIKPYKTSLFSFKILPSNTSFAYFLKTLYRILMSP